MIERGRALLRSSCAADRIDGIMLAAEHALYELVPDLRALLEDDAPHLFEPGDTSVIGEVRFDALEALEDLFRRGRARPDFGPVAIRIAMNADEAVAAAEREAVRARASAFVRERVRPRPEEERALISYRELQELRAVPYQVEEVDPIDYLTPLQREVRARQARTPRPTPHLRVAPLAAPGRTLMFLYRGPKTWVYDTIEGGEAAQAAEFLHRVVTLKGGVPHVVHDAWGAPERLPNGKLRFDGAVDPRTGSALELLRSVAALLNGIYAAKVVEG